jgi:hypothetical protein
MLAQADVLSEHCQLLTPSHCCYLEIGSRWTIQQSRFTDDYGRELLARPAACETILRSHRDHHNHVRMARDARRMSFPFALDF